MRIELQRVQYMPQVLDEGVLYVAEEFGAAAHLCACGCRTKIRTPLGATEWKLSEDAAGVSLSPSVGNWQQPCRSHYWIRSGEIHWSGSWSEEQVQAGRTAEAMRRESYYGRRRGGRLRRAWQAIRRLIRR